MQIPPFVSLCKYGFWLHEPTHSIIFRILSNTLATNYITKIGYIVVVFVCSENSLKPIYNDEETVFSIFLIILNDNFMSMTEAIMFDCLNFFCHLINSYWMILPGYKVASPLFIAVQSFGWSKCVAPIHLAERNAKKKTL